MKDSISTADVMRLLDALSRQELSPEEEQWLNEQLASRQFQERLLALGKAVFPEGICRACEEVLPHYVHLILLDEAADAEYPFVKAHLASCARCTEEYDELYRMVSEVYDDQVPGAPSYPQFDLSLLTPEEAVLVWKQIAARTRRLAFAVSLALFRTAKRLSELPQEFTRERGAIWGPALRPIPATIGAGMRGPEPEPQAMALQVVDQEQGLLAELSLLKSGARFAWLVVRAVELSSGQPLADAMVSLCDAEGRPLETSSSAKNGSVQFYDIERTEYVIGIEHGDRKWEIPLDLRVDAT